MKTQIKEQKSKKEMKKLESFLKEVNAKYQVKENEIVIYGEILGSAFFSPKRWKGYSFSMQIKTDEETFLNLNFDKGYVELNTCKNRMLMTKLIKEISYIMNEKDKIYIVF